jgi:hypothetical protein
MRINTRNSLLHIENGIEDKIPVRIFSFFDLHNIIFRNYDCYKINLKSRPKESKSYMVSFVYNVSGFSFK